MNAIQRAQNYIAKCPPAISGDGGHKTAFSVVCEVVNGFALDENTAFDLLSQWNATCQPAWSDKELRHKISDALNVQHEKPRGHKLTQKGPGAQRVTTYRPHAKPAAPVKPATPAYTLNDAADLPEPMEDGTRLLLRTVFQAGEGIRIAPAKLNEESKEIPDGGGITLSREEWLTKLDRAKGEPNGIFSSTKRTGIYIGVNPYRVGCTKDADVSAYRHALVEFDATSGLSLSAQWDLYQKSRMPCAAIIFSGGESVHAWVKIGAQNRQEFDDRVKLLYQHFEAFHIDVANKNPGRLSRLPNCVRFDRRQDLLALNTGCESFSEWQAEIQSDGIGEVFSVEDLDNFDTANDPNTLLGNRWLCRGGSLLIIGPSGIGKSSLVLQLVIPWSVGRPSFGIQPVKPLKVLLIQAENDEGDMSEMLRGILGGLEINAFKAEAEYETLKKNLIFVRDTSHTSQAFTDAVRRLIDKYHPDLVVFDPLLSFIGKDISRQEVCSEFLRTWLNPIASATGVCWICVHHTGKPSTDPRAKKSWKGTDFAYAGIGSSELTNWTRAAMTIEQAGDGAFRLILSKRGKRAGATHLDGSPALTIWLKHAEKGIFWNQVEAPEQSSTEHKGGKPSDVERINSMNTSSFVTKCTQEGEGLNAISRRLMGWLADMNDDISLKTCQRAIARMVKSEKLKKTPEGLYIKGKNA